MLIPTAAEHEGRIPMLLGALVRSWFPFLGLLVETALLVDILPVEH